MLLALFFLKIALAFGFFCVSMKILGLFYFCEKSTGILVELH